MHAGLYHIRDAAVVVTCLANEVHQMFSDAHFKPPLLNEERGDFALDVMWNVQFAQRRQVDDLGWSRWSFLAWGCGSSVFSDPHDVSTIGKMKEHHRIGWRSS